MAKPSREMLLVNDLLSAYIVIHNDFFKISLRRVIPIPLFFQPMNFARMAKNLLAICAELRQVLSKLKASQSPKIQVEYVSALSETVERLATICLKMSEKIERPASYDRSDYDKDLIYYDALIKKYSEMGAHVPASFQAS